VLLDHDYLNTQEDSVKEDFAADYAPLDRSTVLMLSMLELLHAEHAAGRTQVSLAVICKRLDIRMSTVQRMMTALNEQQLVEVFMQKDRLVAALTAGGEEISRVLITG
jgi:Mn-dependent DtxR family transcriptional regulator